MSAGGSARLVITVTALAAAIAAAGCMGPAFVANLLSKESIPAQFKLVDRPTLVLVDDPAIKLDSPVLASSIADQIMTALRHEKVVTHFIELNKLNDFKVQVGQDYPTTSIDRIGKAVHADQVLSVLIEDVTKYPQPGVFMPRATVTVKVIDVAAGKRLFPPSDFDTKARGHEMSMDLGLQTDMELQTGGEAKAMKVLAARIARDVARLFHSYSPDMMPERSNRDNILDF